MFSFFVPLFLPPFSLQIMKIERFEDRGVAHFSYAILSECAR